MDALPIQLQQEMFWLFVLPNYIAHLKVVAECTQSFIQVDQLPTIKHHTSMMDFSEEIDYLFLYGKKRSAIIVYSKILYL